MSTLAERARCARGASSWSRLGLLVLAVAALAALISVTAQSASSAGGGGTPARQFERIPDAYNYSGFKPASASDRQVKVILELSGASVAKRQAVARRQGKNLSRVERAKIRAQLGQKQNQLERKIASAGGTVLFDYQDAYNGIAARVPLKSLTTLRGLPGVVAVHPVRRFERANVAGATYVRAHEAWNDTGFTGAGTKISIIDTGVDYTHANFGGPGTEEAFEENDSTSITDGGFPTDKVVAGIDFVGDEFVGDNEPSPDPDPLDCNGHGSHVAGTAAGFGVLSDGSTYTGPYNAGIYGSNNFKIGPGTAPDADIIATRVFGCEGFTTEEIIVAALNFSFAEGADVVNMSLGSPFGRMDEPSVEASDAVSAAGVAVVASAGNNGGGAYITGAPSIATRALAVAAIDASSPTFPGANVALSTGKTIVAQNSNDAALPSEPLPVAVLRTSYPDGPVSLGCDPAEYANYPGGVVGKLVVTLRGTCARVARAIFGQQAGAAAVAMINTDAGYPPFEGTITSNPDTGEEFTVTIPFLGIRGVLGPAPQTDPDDLVAADGGTATLTPTTVANPGYQRLASFTSGGPRNLNSAPKPDVTAPGVSVVSTLVGSGDAATRISGTSMASPMTAGVAALVTQAHPDWPSEWIKAAIMNTANATSAKIINPPGANTYDPRRAGTGVVDARRAVDTVAFATTPDVLGALAFGDEALTGPYTETLPFTLSNTSDSDITYDLTTAAFSGLGAGNSPTVTFSDNPVTVPAGDSATVDVTLSLTAAQVAALPGASVSNFGALATFRGVVVATPTSSGAGIYELRIPLLLAPRGLSGVTAGVKGPYQQNGSMFTTTVPLTNSGIHSGIADVYSWGFSDPNDVTGAEDGMDVRAAGVQVLPGEALGGDPSDRALVFAVNVYGKYSNPAVNEIDIALDTEGNSNPEFFVVGVDFGAITTGTFDGRFASVILDPEGNLVNAWVASAPMNGSTMLLPTLASDVGLSTGSDKVRYTVTAFSLIPDGLVDSTATGQFRVYHPPVSTGDFIALAPGGSATLSLTLDKGNFAGTPVLGWIVQTQDDANGAAQADLIPAAPLP